MVIKICGNCFHYDPWGKQCLLGDPHKTGVRQSATDCAFFKPKPYHRLYIKTPPCLKGRKRHYFGWKGSFLRAGGNPTCAWCGITLKEVKETRGEKL